MYFVNQLKHLPSGTPTFDRHCAAAFNTIAAFFRDDAMYTDETPCVLCNRLKRNTDKRVKTHMESQASTFMQHALNKLQESGFNIQLVNQSPLMMNRDVFSPK